MQGTLTHAIITILVSFICLSLVIAIHEAGHALIARFCRIPIQRISIGFGQTIMRWTTSTGCTIELNWFLIGGRVHLLNSRITPLSMEQQEHGFDKKPFWIKTLVLLFGSMTNFLVAIFALWGMFFIGFKQYIPVVKHVTPKSYAARAGLRANDQIVQIDHKNTPFWRDVMMQLIMHTGESATSATVCNPTNDCRDLQLDLQLWTHQNRYGNYFEAFGLTPKATAREITQVKGLPIRTAFNEAWTQSFQVTWFFLVTMEKIITKKIPFTALLGPFRVFQTIIDNFFQGLAIFLYFFANFNIAMAWVNLLPLPSLDGGSIIYGLIEKIRGKPVSIAFELLLYRLFIIVIGLTFIQLILNDLRFYFISA